MSKVRFWVLNWKGKGLRTVKSIYESEAITSWKNVFSFSRYIDLCMWFQFLKLKWSFRGFYIAPQTYDFKPEHVQRILTMDAFEQDSFVKTHNTEWNRKREEPTNNLIDNPMVKDFD